MKTLADLINTADPAWPLIQEWLAEAANPVEILPRDPAAAEAELVKTQVSTRSVMGAVVYETGGILIDHSWLRILGSGSPRLPRGLGSWNLGRTQAEPAAPAPYYLIADDAAGGYFASTAADWTAPPAMCSTCRPTPSNGKIAKKAMAIFALGISRRPADVL